MKRKTKFRVAALGAAALIFGFNKYKKSKNSAEKKAEETKTEESKDKDDDDNTSSCVFTNLCDRDVDLTEVYAGDHKGVVHLFEDEGKYKYLFEIYPTSGGFGLKPRDFAVQISERCNDLAEDLSSPAFSGSLVAVVDYSYKDGDSSYKKTTVLNSKVYEYYAEDRKDGLLKFWGDLTEVTPELTKKIKEIHEPNLGDDREFEVHDIRLAYQASYLKKNPLGFGLTVEEASILLERFATQVVIEKNGTPEKCHYGIGKIHPTKNLLFYYGIDPESEEVRVFRGV